MPLTFEQKKQLIASQGFDPSSHYMDEASGDIFQGQDPMEGMVPAEPIISPPSANISPKSSATTVFAKSAASSAFPALGALGGGALAAQSLPFAHVFPPWSEIAAGIGGAVVGGYGASKLQDAVLPDSAKQAIYPTEQEITEHPYANIAGQIAPNTLAFNPIKSLGSLAKAGKMGLDLATKPISAYANLTAAELAALKSFGLNTGVNVGSQAGINVAQQLSSDKPFNYGELGREAALGLLLNEPTKLGTKAFGFRPSFEGVPSRQDYIERNRAELNPPRTTEPSIELPSMDLASTLGGRVQDALLPKTGKLTPSGVRKLEESQYGMPGLKLGRENERMAQAEMRMEDEGGPILPENYPDPEPLSPAEMVIAEVNQKIKRVEEQQNEINTIVKNLGGTPTQTGITPGTKDVYTPLQEKLQGPKLDRKYPGKFSEESRASLDSLEPEVKELLAKRGIKEGQYRVEIKDSQGNTILGPSNQKPIAGRALYPERQVDLGKEAGADTAYHEAGHIHLEDLARSMDARDRDLVTRAFKEVGSDITAEEFSRLNTEERRLRSEGKVEEANAIREKYIAAEEAIIDYVGFEGYQRKANVKTKSKQYFKDYLSRFNLGEKPAQQQLSARLEHEVPYGSTERIGPEAKTEVKVEVKAEEVGKQQEESELSDYDQYQNVQRKISEKIKAGDYSSEEFKSLWQENENIKNRNKGMPPEKTIVKEEVKSVEEEKPKIENEGKLQEESKVNNPNLLPKKPKLDFITSVTDKISSGKTDKTSTKVSSKLRNYFDEAETKFGEFGQSIALLYKDYSPKDVEAHYKKRWEVDNGINKNQTLTGKAKELDDKFQALIERPKKDAEGLGLKVKRGDDYYTIGGIKEDGYIYNIMDPEVIYNLDNNPSSIEANKARRQWKEWMVKKGATQEEATEMITNWERARRDYGDTGGPEFKALRKPEGFGLPWELMDKNPARAALRYGRRAGNDIAYFKHLQSDPEMLYALGLKDQYGKNPEKVEGIDYIGNEKTVQDAMKLGWGKNRTENPRLAAFARLAGNLVMGTGTAVRNIAALPTQLSVYDVKMKDVFKGLSNIGEARKRAYESGAARLNPADFDYLGDLGNPDKVIKNLDNMSNFLRKWQGRDASDKFEAEFLYSVGEEWAKSNMALARKGDKKASDFLKRALGTDTVPTEVNEENITKIAKGFVGLTRGTYGPQGLPNWALSGNIAPFVALNRYGIEKWNNVYKDVFIPMKDGNIMPFLKYSLAGVATGAMIEQLNEAMSGRKGSDLDIKETLAAYAETGDKELIASKLIGLAQLSAYAGIVGDMAKLGMRGIEGKDLSYSNPLSFPLYTLATETIGENISAAIGAIKSGEDPIDVMAQFVKSVPLSTIQMARYINNRSEEGERKEEFADYRKYQENVMNVDRKEIALGKPNLYEGMERRKFKRTEDIGEAMEMLPSLIEDAIKNSKGDPYKLKAEFRKIKTNNYNTLPDPKNQPIEFWSYVNYLTETQGEEKAAARISKFYSQRYINKAKASLVP